jgi:hypothetical protein
MTDEVDDFVKRVFFPHFVRRKNSLVPIDKRGAHMC